ncbi:probable membrane-associated kinase regulator 4 [Mercurialis annua]|uniref:probable membrane-associated kinase regulator 4 n=1 Tax=Mercurialis annua TaxID=3986 RepID=UPI00215EEEA3|nr:probable membrane-associated kinase regulator 4 [Mercurialis annua]
MAVNFLSYDNADDDYIDMEVGNFLCHSKTLPPQPSEFEFHMSSISLEKEPTTSPADELFYKGKLLPLHLPPRLQMVEKLLEHSTSVRNHHNTFEEDFYSTPLMTALTTPTSATTPFESCNISPSESCRVSRELNPEDYFLDYSNEINPKNSSWTKKLKIIKQSSIGSKLKASRAYLKSLFGKSGCSAESCTAATKVADEGTITRVKESLMRCERPTKKIPFGQIQKINRDVGESGRLHRRSFSMAIKRHSTAKSSSSSSTSSSGSSSSSSINTNGVYVLPFLKRSSSVNAEVENPIQGAIAHCKQSQSQQIFCSRKSATEIGLYSLSASKLAIYEDHEKPELCRG